MSAANSGKVGNLSRSQFRTTELPAKQKSREVSAKTKGYDLRILCDPRTITRPAETPSRCYGSTNPKPAKACHGPQRLIRSSNGPNQITMQSQRIQPIRMCALQSAGTQTACGSCIQERPAASNTPVMSVPLPPDRCAMTEKRTSHDKRRARGDQCSVHPVRRT